jgi:pimeloyl-ACP methyl ester carboxylesterase
MALAQQIATVEVMTPLCPQPVVTSFVQQGTGQPPILLLHGFDSSVIEFRRLLPLLAQQSATWAIDLLGFGFTERRQDVSFSPSAIKTHLYASWETLIREPVVLVGASMGGAAALDFALSYPEAVRQLVLIDSAGLTAGPAMGKYLVPPLGYLATAFLRNLKVRQKISLKAYHDSSYASSDALCCAALHLGQPRWRQALVAFTQSGGYGSFQAEFAQLKPPTLILWGRSDQILGTAAAEQFQQAIVGSKLVWIEDCGHVPHLEKPEETALAILSFLRS